MAASKEFLVGRYAEESKGHVQESSIAWGLLGHVANTFVGSSSEERGVSGGQRRHVSVIEMMPLMTAPVLEITTSPSLDAVLG
jgi:hypothetical protein